MRLGFAPATIVFVMMKALRRHKDWLMIVIAILAIPFVFYFVQRPDYGAMRSDQFARIYDRNISMLEAQQIMRLLSLAQALWMSEFVQTLAQEPARSRIRVPYNSLPACLSCDMRQSGSVFVQMLLKSPMWCGSCRCFRVNREAST